MCQITILNVFSLGQKFRILNWHIFSRMEELSETNTPLLLKAIHKMFSTYIKLPRNYFFSIFYFFILMKDKMCSLHFFFSSYYYFLLLLHPRTQAQTRRTGLLSEGVKIWRGNRRSFEWKCFGPMAFRIWRFCLYPLEPFQFLRPWNQPL